MLTVVLCFAIIFPQTYIEDRIKKRLMKTEQIIETLLSDLNVVKEMLESKRNRILQAAEELEESGYRLDKISSLLSHEVERVGISGDYVRKILPDKYKQQSKVRTLTRTDGSTETEQETPTIKFSKEMIAHPDQSIEQQPEEDHPTISPQYVQHLKNIIKQKDEEIASLKIQLERLQAKIPISSSTPTSKPTTYTPPPNMFSNTKHEPARRDLKTLAKRLK